ncbi:MAG TPA: type II toxin-antitoxin system RelE/ParE family toxin [Phycisphaerae bacterium]|nr:type II toxin-antitoxin system RelE/ParE family toxin [Phycisphaerae bacterium]
MRGFALTPLAESDLTEIRDYLKKQSEEAPRRVLDALHEAMMRLAEMPDLGHLRDDLTDEPFRFWSVFSFLIIYRPETDPLQIVRVLHGARDLKSLLGAKT